MSAANRRRSLGDLISWRADLREAARLRGRVDRAAGVVYGVKVVGRTSPNTHGVRGAEGTVYSLEALERALPLYEGAHVNVDHPPRSRPGQERSSQDRIGQLHNCRVEPEGIFADLHLLTAHPMSERVLEAAESMPGAYALSHNATGKGEVRGGRYVVTEIPEVHSVDIVADGGTNRSLFEGKPVQVRVSEVLRGKVLPALKAGRRKRLQKLLESVPDTLLMEAGEEGKDHLDHLYDAMRSAKDAGHDEVAKGVHKLMHPDNHDLSEEDESESEKEEEEEEGGAGEERAEMEGTGEEGPGEPGEHNQGPDGKGGPATAWESRRPKKKAAPGVVRLTESRAKQLCKAAGVELTADLLETMVGMDLDKGLAVLNLAKRSQAPPRAASAPRSVGPRPLHESAAPAAADARGWANVLLG